MWLDADWSTEENWLWRDVVKPFNGKYLLVPTVSESAGVFLQ